MSKKKSIKSLLAFVLTFAVLITSFSCISVLAEADPTKVTFDYNNGTDIKERAPKTLDPGTITMPDYTTSTDLTVRVGGNARGRSHIIGWINDQTGAYYNVGDVVENVPGGTTFSAVFGNDFFDFNDLTAGMTVYISGTASTNTSPSFGASCASIVELESGNNCLQFTGSSSYTNSIAQFAPAHPGGSSGYEFASYNKGAKYKVTLKYKRTDTTTNESKIYVNFGAGAFSDWLAEARCVQKIPVATTKNDMDEFETVTAVVTAPDNYTYTGDSKTFISRAVAVAVDMPDGVVIQIDDFKIESTIGKTYAEFSYGTGASDAVGNDTIEFVDANGDITLPENASAMNLLWENGGKYYTPGSTVNVSELNGNLNFDAVFGGATQDFESIQTSNITFTLSDGTTTKKGLFQELSRNNYWRVPKGLANAKEGKYNAVALGHDRMGVYANVGNSGKGLQLQLDTNYSVAEYRNAALFSHNPTSFDINGSIDYSYVYYTPNTEYTMEFDYKTTTSVDVAIAFGISTECKNENSGTKSVNSGSYADSGNHISLASTNGEWAHASVTVTSPASYTGNGVTSARVGIAVKDNGINPEVRRYDYFDNISFYPTSLGKMEFDFGGYDEGEFIKNAPFYQEYSSKGFTIPAKKTSTATFYNGGTWTVSRGDAIVDGWLCNETGKYYPAGDAINGIPANATFSAVYGNHTVNFNNIPTDFTIYDGVNNNMSYGSPRTTIETLEDGNNCIKFTGTADDSASYAQMVPLYKDGSYYRMIGYNKGAKYKVSFKYRRTDDTDADSDLYISFGAMTIDWRAAVSAIQKTKVATTNKNMSEFETVTAIVTAPDTYSGANVTGCDGRYSKAIAVAATLSNGVEIEIDDFEIESSIGNSFVTFDKNIGDNDVTSDMVENGEVMSELPEVSYDGYEFCGWYDNRLGNGNAVSSVIGTGEIQKYYAKWVPALSGDTAAVTISGNALSNYQVVLPQNKTLVLADALEDFNTFITSKGATTTAQSKQIIVEDTSSKTIAKGNSSYTIKVEGNNLLISATDDAAMAGALARLIQFIETAYEQNKTLNFASDYNFTQNFVADDSQYSYTWSDEFGGEDLDKSIWLKRAGYQEPGQKGYQIGTGTGKIKNDDSGLYSIGSQGVFVDNGSAVIRAEKVNAADGAGNQQYFISRGLSSIGSLQYTYGCVEIKAKLSAHPAAPSIWLYSSQNVDTTAELDLHEGIGKVSGYENNQQIVSNIHASYHLASDAQNRWKSALDDSQPLDSSSSQRIYLGGSKTNFDNDYHIYSVKWTPDEIVFALDGEPYYIYDFDTSTDLLTNAKAYNDPDSPFTGLTNDQIKDCFSKQMYINFGNTMGNISGDYGPVYMSGDPEQADLLVDYVRIYQSESNEGSSFMNKPYTRDEIAEFEESQRAYLAEKGIENRGNTTKEITMSGEGISTETFKINLGDTLPVNYKIGSKYIYGWTDGTDSVKTYKDASKTYTPQFVDTCMLDIKYKVANVDNGNCNLLFTSTVDANWSNYSKAGFVYSVDPEKSTPKIGSSNCISVDTTKVYEDGLFSNYTNLLDCSVAGYSAYSKYMFNFALDDIALSNRTNDIYVRSYVVLSDGRVIYSDVLTIAADTALSSSGLSAFDNYIAERLASGATLDNIADYNTDGYTNLLDLVNLNKTLASNQVNDIDAPTLVNLRKVLLSFNDSKIK